MYLSIIRTKCYFSNSDVIIINVLTEQHYVLLITNPTLMKPDPAVSCLNNKHWKLMTAIFHYSVAHVFIINSNINYTTPKAVDNTRF